MFKTLEKIIKYPRLTQEYPKKAPDATLFVGRPEISSEKCSGCGECAVRCPSGAIEGGTGTGKAAISYDRCVFCALCEEICPKGAVRMTHDFELARKDRKLLKSTAFTVSEDNMPELGKEELENRLEKRISKLFGRSLHIREVDAGSCNGCDYEINALNNPFNDIERLGIHFVASPRHADMLLVTGPVSRNMEEALIKTYNAAPDPKLVVAAGACACSGGIFRDCYAVGGGIDTVIPVDVYVPGCPPRPQAILYGILKALDRVK
ncbi:MAG TPA: NADH-quinone oxidoreductase subunit NuoB [Clostridia bacterium]|nr:NADH-quinone oxidoreductase subunit NuoB [Clostridia bacterium]